MAIHLRQEGPITTTLCNTYRLLTWGREEYSNGRAMGGCGRRAAGIWAASRLPAGRYLIPGELASRGPPGLSNACMPTLATPCAKGAHVRATKSACIPAFLTTERVHTMISLSGGRTFSLPRLPTISLLPVLSRMGTGKEAAGGMTPAPQFYRQPRAHLPPAYAPTEHLNTGGHRTKQRMLLPLNGQDIIVPPGVSCSLGRRISLRRTATTHLSRATSPLYRSGLAL